LRVENKERKKAVLGRTYDAYVSYDSISFLEDKAARNTK
jgi:hypothetical protein